ncbi:MAG: NAD(P)H-hydrate dehydratase [Bacteroidota bacterium]|nr:NAD(P)H-hydrate dehydratase [Bacteroidota bacterium]MDP3144316.1 NAD(P)H-hydrate dehydratase [Bacteroidota bacterium]
MKIFSAQQLKQIDEETIANEPISSLDLMERASMACTKRIMKLINTEDELIIFCGKGNNGGDGLAITRLLLERGFICHAYIINYTDKFSVDAKANYDKLKTIYTSSFSEINSLSDLKEKITRKNYIVIDALIGTGINKIFDGLLKDTVTFINANFSRVISIDVPSGLFIDESSDGNENIICSSLTLTFQFPKLAFLFAENKKYVPEFEVLDIGISSETIDKHSTNFYYTTKQDVASFLKPRNKFSHKGDYGHALLLAGSKGKSGAAIISSKACLRSGAGLLTLHSNKSTVNGLLHHLPEAMSIEDSNPDFISEVDKPEKYDAIGFGPGVGTEEETQTVLKKICQYYAGKLIIDADGINILSENKTWLDFLPPETILTPHPKEFERLVGKQENDFEKIKALKHFCLKYFCIVVLKGAHSAIAFPDGTVFFNSSGNPGLAKGGSGDGLTGIILGLLSRGYTSPKAALIGTFIHGYAADLCLKKKSMESILISDVIEQLPIAFKKMEN